LDRERQNWSLPNVSSQGVEQIGNLLRRYKAVRNDITGSDPVVTGDVGSSPGIHEKVSKRSGKGVVVFFAIAKGSYRYITAHQPHRTFSAMGSVKVHYDAKGHAVIEADSHLRARQSCFSVRTKFLPILTANNLAQLKSSIE